MATFTVTNAEDSGLGSLRQAIEDANAMLGSDTIEFDQSLNGEEITLTGGELQIRDELTINGLGAENLTVSGNNSSGVFFIDDENSEVTIDGLTIADGDSGLAVGYLSSVEVTNSTISGNVNGIIAFENSSIQVKNSSISNNVKAGILSAFAYGPIEVFDSTISGNGSGGTGNGGILLSRAGVDLINSTVSNNQGPGIIGDKSNVDAINSTIADNQDSGIKVEIASSVNVTDSTVSGNQNTGILVQAGSQANVSNSTISGNANRGLSLGPTTQGTITNSTITGNQTDSGGGGIYFEQSIFSDPEYGYYIKYELEVEDTIIAGNFDSSSSAQPDVAGIFNSTGYNLIGDGSGSTGFDAAGDQVGTTENPIDPLIGTLQDNGGSTQTHALLAGSPAIEGGNPNFQPPPELDQRGEGFPRVVDSDGDGVAVLDIGAFEFSGSTDSIVGTPGDDLLIGTAKGDRIEGFAGNDTIIGKAGNDVILAGAGNDLIEANKGDDNLTGGGNQDQFVIAVGDGTNTITDFGGVGSGRRPSIEVIEEVDTIQFVGQGLTAENMLLTQQGSDLKITFEGVEDTIVILENFALEELENLRGRIGNILFDRQQRIEDDFDVFDANLTRNRVFNRNTVTFLNDLDNTTKGFNNSDDVINGLGGNDILSGRRGNDLLRGSDGNDVLDGGRGNDRLWGGADADQFLLRVGDGTNSILDFEDGIDSLGLTDGLTFEQLEINSSSGNTLINFIDTGELLAELVGVDVSDVTIDDFVIV